MLRRIIDPLSPKWNSVYAEEADGLARPLGELAGTAARLAARAPWAAASRPPRRGSRRASGRPVSQGGVAGPGSGQGRR